MDSNSITNKEVRQKYEEKLSSESRLMWTYNLQWYVKQSLMKALKNTNKFLEEIYSVPPIVDSELAELLDKYTYPEEEKVKIFKALNIPYKGFREWQTNDGLFKPTAKFIFYDAKVKEATLEREDGKRMSIEWSVLRKEDQEYIREQIKLDQKKLKD